jgi:hypothetical protein
VYVADKTPPEVGCRWRYLRPRALPRFTCFFVSLAQGTSWPGKKTQTFNYLESSLSKQFTGAPVVTTLEDFCQAI